MVLLLLAATLGMDEALRLKDEKKYEQAAQILRRFPGDADAVNNLGGVRFLMGDFDGAETDFGRAAMLAPSDPNPLGNRCLLRIVRASAESALADCDAALERDPEHYAAWNNKGYALFELGRYAEAIPVFAQAMKLQPQSAEPYLGLALCALRGGKRAEAPKYWRRAVELKPALGRSAKAYEAEEGPFFGPQTLSAYRELARLFPVKRRD